MTCDRPNRAAALSLVVRRRGLSLTEPRPNITAFRREKVLAGGGEGSGYIEVRGVIDAAAVARLRSDLRKYPDARRLTLSIDSEGGGVSSAFEMFAMLREHRGIITAHVKQQCSSAANVVLAAADIRSAAPDSVFLLHSAELPPGRGTARWTAQRHRARASVIAEADESIAEVLAERCGAPRERYLAEMRSERTMCAGTAMSLGLCHWLRDLTTKPHPAIAAGFAAKKFDLNYAFGASAVMTSRTFLEACKLSGSR